MGLKDYTCDRCGETKMISLKMSWFNQGMLCSKCQEKEELHPNFCVAKASVLNEERKRNTNYEGIGLPNDLIEKRKYNDSTSS